MAAGRPTGGRIGRRWTTGCSILQGSMTLQFHAPQYRRMLAANLPTDRSSCKKRRRRQSPQGPFVWQSDRQARMSGPHSYWEGCMKQRTTIMVAGLMISAAPALAAEVTAERLVNADREPQNWLMNHRTYDAQRYSPLDRINKANVKNLKLAYAVAIGGTSANENLASDAAGRGRLSLRGRPVGRALQDRRPLRRGRPHRVAHGSGPGEDCRWPTAAPRCGAISSSPSPIIRRA